MKFYPFVFFLCAVLNPQVHALINPSFTPVHLVEQSTEIWRGGVHLDEGGDAFRVEWTENLKGTATKQAVRVEMSDAPQFAKMVMEELDEGKGSALFFQGDFEGGEQDTWAMMKLGAQWYKIAGSDGAGRLEEDPIDLSMVWAGDDKNLQQAVRYILAVPDADVPVRSDGRWAEETKLTTLEGTVTGMEMVTLSGKRWFVVYREEGDVLLDSAKEFQDVTGELGLTSASTHAVWGGFAEGGALGIMSVSADGDLGIQVWEDGTFSGNSTGLRIENVTGLAAMAYPGRARLLVGTSAGMRIAEEREGEWTLAELPSPQGAEEAGPVLALDVNGSGEPDLFQSYANGLARVSGGETRWVEHPGIGTPLVLAPADMDGDGRMDLFVTGTRGGVLLIQDEQGAFSERLATSGELAYNLRPGVSGVLVGDHNLDGRVDLVLLNHRMPPQIYFNRGFGVFGYDMELDLAEDVPDVMYAVELGQQAGLLVDSTGDGLQELMMISTEGELWHVTRAPMKAPPLAARLVAPEGLTGPIPVEIRAGDRLIGSRIVSPHAPAFVGRRNRGPIDVHWVAPGTSERRQQRVIVLRSEDHLLKGE